MTNIINLSKEKSTSHKGNGKYQFKSVFLKSNHESIDAYSRTWEIDRKISGKYHIIISKVRCNRYNYTVREYTKVYNDNMSFEKALKRLQAKIDKLNKLGLLLKVYTS